MRTKVGFKSRMALGALSCVLTGMFALQASADVVSDQSGAILIFPKIVVDTTGELGDATDTVIQITNTSNSVVSARCFYVDATSVCSDDNSVACTDETATSRCSGTCDQQWTKRDFRFTLTKRQPIAFRASEGMLQLPCDIVGPGCAFSQSNVGGDGSPSSIPPVARDPFVGELKCVQVDPDNFEPSAGLNPANNGAGDLAGHATIIDDTADASKHNAIALQSTTVNNQDDVLEIGGANPEYSACPHALVLNHVFDDASVEYAGGSADVQTDLTVIPCSQDFLNDENNLGGGVLQFLVFNEFEQRFSASTRYECWRTMQLSDIDSRPGDFGDDFSVFNVGVQGTIGGQTRIRPVADAEGANGVLAVAEQRWGDDELRAAANIHYVGATAAGDQIILSPDIP